MSASTCSRARSTRRLSVTRGVSEAAFFCQDFHRASHVASASVALGALIDGAPCASERERQRRLGRFVSSCVRLGRHQGVIVTLEQGWLERHGGALALEPALFGVRAGEELEALRSWMSSALDVTTSVRAGGLSSDVALFWARGSQGPELLRRSDEQLLARVFEQDDLSCEQPFWRAWLCAQIEGMEARALKELERALRRGAIDRYDRARAALLYERLSGEEVEQGS